MKLTDIRWRQVGLILAAMALLIGLPARPSGIRASSASTTTLPDAGRRAASAMTASTPVLHLPFDEAAGATTFSDGSGNGYDATCSGDACPIAGGSGWYGDALNFDGVDDYVEIPYQAALNPESFTAAAWVKVTGGSGYRAVWTSRDIGMPPLPIGESGYILYVTPDNTWEFWVGTGASDFGGQGWVSTGGTPVMNDVWMHLATVYDANADTMALYVNGQLVSSRADVYMVYNSQRPFRVGAGVTEDAPELFFPGLIDDVRVYANALSSDEIRDLYRLHLPLDEAAGATTFTDVTGKGHAGTCTGTACPTAGQAGVYSDALSFDGTDDYVEVPYQDAFNPVSFTAAAWVKVTGGSGHRAVWTSRDHLQGHMLYANPDNTWSFIVGNGVEWIGVGGARIANDTWTHLASVYDANAETMALYVNGRLMDSQANVAMMRNTQRPFRLGAGVTESDPDFFFPGLIDDMRVYNRAFNATEVVNLANGLALHLPLNEAADATTFVDDSGNGYDGGCSIAYDTCPTPGDAGRLARAARFDGLQEYIEILYQGALNPTSFTAAAWVKVTGGSGYRAVWTSRDASPLRGYILYATPDNTWEFWVGTDTDEWVSIGGASVTNDVWTHLATAYDAASQSMFFYVNGALVASETGVAFVPNTQRPLRIGAGVTESDPEFFFTGLIDDVRIHDRALNAVEVADLADGLALHLPLDEAAGAAMFADIGGNGNNGTCLDADNCPTAGVVDEARQAASFDGTNDTIVLPSAAALGLQNSDFTVAAWVNLNSIANQPTVLGTAEAVDSKGLHLNVQDGKPYMGFYSNDLAGQTALSTGRWYHLVWRYTESSGEQAMFVDGVLDASEIGHAPFQGNGTVYVGRAWDTAHFFNGLIDEVRIYAWPLSTDEIAALAVKPPEITVTPSRLDFGEQAIGAGPTITRAIVIVNEGHGDLTIQDVTFAGDVSQFKLNDSGESVVAPGSNRTLDVAFDPDSSGTKVMTVTITSDDADESTLEVPVTGGDNMLTLHLPLNDAVTSTTFVDVSGNQNDGVCTGDACPTAGHPGYLDQAVQFDGVDDAITLPTADVLGLRNSDFTVSAWVKLNSTANDPTILGTTEARPNEGLHLNVKDGKPYMGFYGNDLAGQTVLSTGRWYHLVWRYTQSNGEQAIFVDGALDAHETGHAAFQGSGTVYMGRAWSGVSFNGLLDDVRIYDRALSDAEIVAFCPPPPEITVTPHRMDFGVQAVGAGPTFSRTIVIVNEGPGDLTIHDVTSAGDVDQFNLVDSGEGVLAPGANRTLNVAFDPDSLGTKIITVTITSNDPDESTVEVPVTGGINWLSLHLPLNETETISATTFVDVSGNQNDGVCVDDACPTAGTIGRLRYAPQFDGVDDAITLPTADVLKLQNSDFTVAAWVKLNSTAYTSTILGTTETMTNEGLLLNVQNGKPYMGFYDNDLAGQTALSTGRWHHLVWRYTQSSGEQAIFVDGVLDAHETGHDAFQGGGTVYVGRAWDPSHFFNGLLDEVRIYRRGLNAEEIESLAATKPELFISPASSLNLGAEDVEDATMLSYTVAISNVGTTDLLIDSITSAGDVDQFILDDSGEGVLVPGAMRTLDVIFAPDGRGVKAMTLTLTTDGTDDGTSEVNFTGKGDNLATWLYLPLDEEAGATTFVDRIGIGEPGACVGESCPIAGVAGRARRAVQFDGLDDYIAIPYKAELNPLSFSIGVWVKVTGGEGTYRTPVTARDEIAYTGYNLYATPANTWEFRIGDGTAWHAVGGIPVRRNVWTHLLGIYNARTRTMSLYVNGELAGTQSDADLVPNETEPLRIGSNFMGIIDEVRIYMTYDDFIAMENRARERLERGMEARLAFSPYRGNLEFSEYVARFDYEAGWSKGYTGPTSYAGVVTLMDQINHIEEDMRVARDLYAYLATYAPGQRFRGDTVYITDTLTGYSEPLCGATNKEDPNPPDPDHTGLVIDPVIDWCDFGSRMRQSVREVAYLRMIFGQQFMVDALGLQFSGTSLLGGEDAVRQELARLRAAKHQYELAAEALTEALDYRLGSGCYISDYFMQPDWALFSRALEAQSTAQHEIAVRLSYLDVPAQPDGPHKRREEAVDALRPAAANSYINIAGMAGMGATQPVSGCARGVRPDGALAAEMALNLAAARRQAAEMSEGRNIFGYDVTFTPARFYKSSQPQSCDSSSMADRGLWDEAWCAAELAQELQDAEAVATREYNNAQADLRDEIENILNGIDEEITELSGCANEGDDAAWYACVDQQISRLNTCLLLVKDPVMGGTSQFDICMSKPQVLNSAAKRALWDLREVYVQLHSTKAQVENIHGRIAASGARSAVVSAALFASGAAETVARVSDAALNMTSCCDASVGFDFGVAASGKAAACAGVGSVNLVVQAAAGAISTLAEVTIEGAETAEEIANMLLDQSELAIDAYGAMQQYNSNLAEYHALLDLIRDKVTEAQRKRAYFQNSPANDPSFRLVRDSTRLQFSNQMAYASRMAYLAARRAEYEYAARLNASNVRFSDVYRARTANDLRVFLNQLRGVTDSLPGGPSYQTNTRDLTLSVAQHWLHLTDDVLISEGFTTTEAIEAERIRRFRLWVAENTVPNDFESPYDNKPVLRFNLTTSLVEGGAFSNLIPQGYDGYWLTKLSGVAVPHLANNGFSINMVTPEDAMSYRIARVTQSGLVHLRSQSGCYFDYRLIAPSAMLGWEWASNQSPESAVATLNANINEAHAYTENGFRTSDFYGRSVSATNWEVVIFSGAPELGLSDMDLQQLTDIELNFSMTYASRTPGEPQLSECTRIDW